MTHVSDRFQTFVILCCSVFVFVKHYRICSTQDDTHALGRIFRAAFPPKPGDTHHQSSGFWEHLVEEINSIDASLGVCTLSPLSRTLYVKFVLGGVSCALYGTSGHTALVHHRVELCWMETPVSRTWDGRQHSTRRMDQISVNDVLMICAFQDRLITGLHDLHGL